MIRKRWRQIAWLRGLDRTLLPMAFLYALLLVEWRLNLRYIVDPLLLGGSAVDWELYREAGRLITTGGSPYDAATSCGTCTFRHSPVVAWAFSLPFSLEVYRVAHLAVLPLLGRRIALLTLAAWPFWSDVALGQPMTFAFVLAVLALRGSRWAGVGFLVMVTLMPRPLMLPVAAWLLWQRPEVRTPFLAASAVHLALVVPWAGDWALALLSGTADLNANAQLAPSRIIGPWWIVIGLPLAVWLTRRGRLGLASLAASPYWFGYYLLFALLPDRPPAAVAVQMRPHARRVAHGVKRLEGEGA